MRIKIGELKLRARRNGTKQTWNDIEVGTGIRKQSLIAMDNGTARQIRPEYLDALVAFFAVPVDELLEPESITLPLRLNVRPDKQGLS